MHCEQEVLIKNTPGVFTCLIYAWYIAWYLVYPWYTKCISYFAIKIIHRGTTF